MDKGKGIMAVAIKPIRRRRRTAQRGKPISQSKRWGKVTTMTPVPQGVISTSEGPVDPVQEVVPVLDEAIAAADAEEAVEEYDDINSDQA
jgi:hypothetical protein